MPRPFLRLQAWVLLILISGLFWLISGGFVFAQTGQGAWAPVKSHQGQVWRATSAQINLTVSQAIPAQGWTSQPLPQIALANQATPDNQGIISAWAKVEFERVSFGTAPIGIMTENNREAVTIYLNGTKIFTNRPDPSKNVLGWNRTYAVLLPAGLLRDGGNEIIVQSTSQKGFNMGIGTIEVGDFKTLTAYAQSQHIKRIIGPVTANVAMLVLAFAALLMWLARPKEEPILWLALTAMFWFIRNYHFFALEVPFSIGLFRDISYYSIYFAISASLSFCVVFLDLPKARWIVIGMFGAGIILSLGRVVAFQIFQNDGVINLLALGVVVLVLGLMIKDAIKRPSLDHYSLIGVVCAIVGLSVHDIGRISNLHWWDGLGFHSQPYIGFVLFIVFAVSVGRRFVGALTMVERLNVTLEQRVEEARLDLARSEAARRDLEVLSAVDSERERLMREMHDGIGSNLITALAIAQKQNESPGTVATLKRAISDLKITVDSLAPIEGDLVALLANFRHRIEPDLKLAGIKCVWQVQDCPPLEWLDPVNALQILRIIQEAIGNVLTHAQANTLTIGCQPHAWNGQQGIVTTVHDNGLGFDTARTPIAGHGLANIAARAQSLGGVSQITGSAGTGTNVWIWLPLVRV